MRLRLASLSSLIALAAALLPPAAAHADLRDNSVGMNTHVPPPDILDSAQELGVAWIRVDANWWQLEPSRGSFDWGFMDSVVDGAGARGLSVYMTLAYTAEWVPKVARARDDSYTGNDEPVTSAEWVAFVEAAVARYRSRGVTHFGIWNEPNLNGFWEEEAGVDSYIDKILVPGAAAVRRVCDDCRVLGPDLAHVGAYDEFMDVVLRRASDSFDIIAHHSYNGFEETGHNAFAGDSFLQAIEERRSSFTRIALRELLDVHGWEGEVWITETGYRATVGDAADEDLQAVYVRRVLEEQLLRGWWTNTFFYEISDCGVDQPDCDIDGFGITRPGRTGARAFPADYRLKPAYSEIQSFVREHPEILTMAEPTQCDDGLDNDGDGRVDRDDRGCGSLADDRESDDPPRRRFEALPTPTSGLVVDGSIREWGGAGFTLFGPGEWAGPTVYGGLSDATVRAAARFDEGSLYFAFEVTDDIQDNDAADSMLFTGDSIQIAFDVGQSLGAAYDGDDHEVTIAIIGGLTQSVRFHGDGTDTWEAVVRRRGTSTTYEVRFPAESLPPATLREGEVLGFTFLVNDADGAGREGWLEFTPGIGASKDPYLFGELALVATASPPPPDGGPPADGGGPDGGPADGGADASDGGGGGCSTSTGDTPRGLLGLAVLGLALTRRRRPSAR